MQLAADGGVGKSTVVWHWLEQLRSNGFAGAPQIMDWSFYSQGQHEYASDSRKFLDEAVRHFGVQLDAEKCKHAEQIGEAVGDAFIRTGGILILDGVEPLQFPPEMGGHLKDEGLRGLLTHLRYAPPPGEKRPPRLLVLTTRWPIGSLEGKGIATKLVTRLTDEAGARLLRNFRRAHDPNGKLVVPPLPGAIAGEAAEGREFLEAAQEYGGHALALVLLASYILRCYGGNLRMRDRVPLMPEDTRNDRPYRHARRIMREYERLFASDPASPSLKRCRQLLHLMGLFDRPADAATTRTLRRAAVAGLTDLLQSDADWAAAVSDLRASCLLLAASPSNDGALDAHPLIREHFGNSLKQQNPSAWQAAHQRLYDFYLAGAEELPATLAEMAPLFDAMAHGCKAGLAQSVFDDVFMRRILRGRDLYAPRKLGGFGAQLSAMSHFFEQGDWKRPLPDLAPASQAFIVKQCAEILRGLNRAEEALEAYTSAVERLRKLGDLQTASHAAIRQSELLLTRAELSAAEQTGKVALDISSELARTGADRERYIQALANIGAVMHARGNFAGAGELFRECEQMMETVTISNPDFTAFLHWCLLLDMGEAAVVRAKGEAMLARARSMAQPPSLMNFACDHISIARAIMLQALQEPAKDWSGDLGEARSHLDEAVRLIRKSGHFFNLPWALLPRAELRHSFPTISGAEAGPIPDLDEVLDITSRGQWTIHECPARILRGRALLEPVLFGYAITAETVDYAVAEGKRALARADQIVRGKDGCRRYRVDVAYLKTVLLLAKRGLAKAKGEVAEVAQLEQEAAAQIDHARAVSHQSRYKILAPCLDRVTHLLGDSKGA